MFCELRVDGVLGNSCRLSPMKIAPVPSQQPVVDTVLIGSPLLVVLRSGPFVTHPDLLHHPARGRVASQVLRVDAVQPYPLEPVAHDLPGGLRGVPTAPVRPPYPVAQLGVVFSSVRVQRDGTYQLTFLAQNDGPGEGFPCLVGGTEKSDPLLGHAVFVGVGHDRKRTRHHPLADEALHVKCVLRRELSKCEPGGVQLGVGFHTPSYPYSPTSGEEEFSEVRASRVLGTLLLAKNLDALGRPSLPGLHPLTVASYNVILVSVDGISARAATPSPTRSGAASTKLWVTGKPTSCLSTTMRESMASPT